MGALSLDCITDMKVHTCMQLCFVLDVLDKQNVMICKFHKDGHFPKIEMFSTG